jgi:hypothetical protein
LAWAAAGSRQLAALDEIADAFEGDAEYLGGEAAGPGSAAPAVSVTALPMSAASCETNMGD